MNCVREERDELGLFFWHLAKSFTYLCCRLLALCKNMIEFFIGNFCLVTLKCANVSSDVGNSFSGPAKGLACFVGHDALPDPAPTSSLCSPC